MYNVFLSYLREDKAQALRLAQELEANGGTVFVDVADLAIGATWRKEIAEAIKNAEFFLACFSSTYQEQPNNGMLEELMFAISLRKAGQKNPEILPLKFNECDIPDLQIDSERKLSDLHWFLLDDENWAEGVKQLVEITLRLAKERAKSNLTAEAQHVVAMHAELVRAREELTTHDHRVIRQNVNRQMFRNNSREYSSDWRDFELPNTWPAQNVAKKETEYEYALSQYHKHQVEFVRRFGEDYHPLGDIADKMDETEKRIHQSFERARQKEEADIEQGLRDMTILVVVIAIIGIVLGVLWSVIKSWLGF